MGMNINKFSFLRQQRLGKVGQEQEQNRQPNADKNEKKDEQSGNLFQGEKEFDSSGSLICSRFNEALVRGNVNINGAVKRALVKSASPAFQQGTPEPSDTSEPEVQGTQTASETVGAREAGGFGEEEEEESIQIFNTQTQGVAFISRCSTLRNQGYNWESETKNDDGSYTIEFTKDGQSVFIKIEGSESDSYVKGQKDKFIQRDLDTLTSKTYDNWSDMYKALKSVLGSNKEVRNVNFSAKQNSDGSYIVTADYNGEKGSASAELNLVASLENEYSMQKYGLEPQYPDIADIVKEIVGHDNEKAYADFVKASQNNDIKIALDLGKYGVTVTGDYSGEPYLVHVDGYKAGWTFIFPATEENTQALIDAGLIEEKNTQEELSVIDCDSNISVVRNYLSEIFPDLFEQGILDDELCKQLGFRAKMFLFQNRGVSDLSDETIIKKCLEAQAQLASEAIAFGFDVNEYITKFLAMQMDFICPIETAVAGARGMNSITEESDSSNSNGFPDYITNAIEEIYGAINYKIYTVHNDNNRTLYQVHINKHCIGCIIYDKASSLYSITLKDGILAKSFQFTLDGKQVDKEVYIDTSYFIDQLVEETSLAPEDRKYFKNGVDDIYKYISENPNFGFDLIRGLKKRSCIIFDKSAYGLATLVTEKVLNNLGYNDILSLRPTNLLNEDFSLGALIEYAENRYKNNSGPDKNTIWTYDGELFNQASNQNGIGDCYLLAAIFSVKQNTKFKQFIKSIVDIDTNNGIYTITLHGKEYKYTIEQLISSTVLSKGEDLDVRAFEQALGESLIETGNIIDAGFVSKVLLAFLGCKINFKKFDKDMCQMGIVSTWGRDSFGKDSVNNNIKFEQVLKQIRSGQYMSNIGLNNHIFGYDEDGNEIPLSLGHAYSPVGCDDKFVYLVNPWDSSSLLKITLEDFKNNCNYDSIKVSDFIDIVLGKNEKMNEYLKNLEEPEKPNETEKSDETERSEEAEQLQESEKPKEEQNDGYDKEGYDKNGYDRDGYDRNGFNRYGEYKYDRTTDDVVIHDNTIQGEQNEQAQETKDNTKEQDDKKQGEQETEKDKPENRSGNEPIFNGKVSSDDDSDMSPEEEEEFIDNTLDKLNSQIPNMYQTPYCDLSDGGEILYPYDCFLIDTVTEVGEGLKDNMNIGDYVYRANLKAALKDLLTKILGQLSNAGVDSANKDLSALDDKTLTDLGNILDSYGISWEAKFDNGVLRIKFEFSFESSGELKSEYKDGYQVWIKGYCFIFKTQPKPHWEFDEESTINGQ